MCIKQYICTNLFLCFLVREMNSWPLMLILWYAGRRREDHPPTPTYSRPPSSPYGTPLCRRGKQKHKQKGGRESLASRQKHFPRCTSCGWSLKVSLLGLTAPPSLFQPPSTLPSFLPLRAGDVTPSSLLRCHWPAAPPVSSVPRGYCRDVTFSWQHHWASPPSPMGSATGLQLWGVGGWATAGRWDGIKPSLPGLPLSTPQQSRWLRTS